MTESKTSSSLSNDSNEYRRDYGIRIKTRRGRNSRHHGKQSLQWNAAFQKLGLGFLLRITKHIFGGLKWLMNSVFLLSLPLASILFITSTDFLVLTSVNDSVNQLFFDEIGSTFKDYRRDDVELLKTEVLKVLYLYTLVFSLFHIRYLYGYFKSWPHLILLLSSLLIGVLYSIEPIKVFTNTVLILVGICVSVLFCRAHSEFDNYDALFKVVFFPLLLLHVSSFAIFFLYDIPLLEFLKSTQRYGGLAGNPNSFGATVVLGYWAAISLLLSSSVGYGMRLVALFALPLFLLHVFMSGSGTALVALVIVTVTVFWLQILALFKLKARMILNLFIAFVLICVSVAMVFSSTPAEIFLAFTTSLGKDQTLTGRTELWSIAQAAIMQRPYLGWGFDSHATVKAVGAYDIEFNHYHNGYLDTLVAGGFVLMIFLLNNLYRFVRSFTVEFRIKQNVFPLILPLIILLFLNFSEYSLLRPNSMIWQVYIATFIILTYKNSDYLFRNYGRTKIKNNSRSKTRQLRWA